MSKEKESTGVEPDEVYTASSISDGDAAGAAEPMYPDVEEEQVPTHDTAVVVDVVVPKVKATTTNPEAVRPGVAVSGSAHDEVLLKQCIYKNKFSRKSLSVHHLQRRLGELGFRDALSEVDGWYGDLTRHSVQEFQRAKSLNVTEDMNQETLVSIFKGDPHIILVY